MSTLSLRLPNSVHRHIKEIAKREGVSVNQLISSAVSEKVSAIATEDYILKRVKKANRKKFREILDKVPSREPMEKDKLV